MKRNVTIKDIAKKLGIAPSTVSRALKGHPEINSNTIKRVKAKAKEMNYHPNLIARNFQRQKTNVIGVIVPEIRHQFFSGAISGIEEVAYQHGFSILVSQSNQNYEREQKNIDVMVSNQVAGLLISISETTMNKAPFERLVDRNVPFVFFDRAIENMDVGKVVADDFGGAYEAVEHLIKARYKKIFYIGGPRHLLITKERLRGYNAAMKDYNLPVSSDWIMFGGLDEEDGVKWFRKLMTRGILPEAIFAINDPVAIGLHMKIKQAGLRIPQDIALIGFSNNMITALVDPPLTTIEQSPSIIGAKAAKMLINQIENNQSHFDHTEVIETRLIIRQSS